VAPIVEPTAQVFDFRNEFADCLHVGVSADQDCGMRMAGVPSPAAVATLVGVAAQHGGRVHWQRIVNVARAMARNGWLDIRINRQQVDAAGRVVGRNRPDISGVHPRTGIRHNLEFDWSARSSALHRAVVTANDPNAKNTFIILSK
jgi:hypothetical protein